MKFFDMFKKPVDFFPHKLQVRGFASVKSGSEAAGSCKECFQCQRTRQYLTLGGSIWFIWFIWFILK